MDFVPVESMYFKRSELCFYKNKHLFKISIPKRFRLFGMNIIGISSNKKNTKLSFKHKFFTRKNVAKLRNEIFVENKIP